MQAIVELARQLGKAVADSAQAARLQEARKALEADARLVQTLNDFQAHTDRLSQLEAQQKPIEVADKQKLEDLHRQLISSDLFKKYTAAQVEYVDLMRQVNDALTQQLRQTEEG